MKMSPVKQYIRSVRPGSKFEIENEILVIRGDLMLSPLYVRF